MTKRKILNLVNNGVLFAHSDLSFVEYLFEEEVNGIESEINNGIAHVRIDDLLYFGTDERAVQSYVSLLKRLQKEDTVQGVIIEIDSGGGHDAASDYIGNAVAELAGVKPVIAYGHMIASGAYLMERS